MSSHEGAGNQTAVLQKHSQCSELLSHPSLQPPSHFLFIYGDGDDGDDGDDDDGGGDNGDVGGGGGGGGDLLALSHSTSKSSQKIYFISPSQGYPCVLSSAPLPPLSPPCHLASLGLWIVA